MKQKNTKYTNDLLFLRSEIMNSNAYKQSLNGFLDNFKINGKEYVIYNVWIKTLLLWGLLPEHKNELKNIKINSYHYQDCYIKGYEKGQKYFIENYENDLRETKETLVNNILYLNKDVSKVLTTDQLILNDKVFENYGYYSGIRTEMLRFEKEKKSWFDENALNHNLTTKRFVFKVLIAPFKKNEYENICKEVENYKNRFIKLYDVLDERDKNELEYDTIDHLNKLLKEQNLTKYKVLFSGLINEIEKFNIDSQKVLPPQPISIEQNITLSDLITHQKSVEIVEKVKVKYKNIKGKRLKLLLLVFQDLKLLPKERIAKQFHTCCENEFNWKIATYNAMNGYKFNDKVDSEDVAEMMQYIKTLIETN